ncbi:glycosyl hydrolase-related protein [Ruthenibacterium lactatiformans]
MDHAAQLTREAAVRNRPFRVCKETYHPGSLGHHYSGLEISGDRVAAGTFKRAEEGEGWVLRLHETTGRACKASVAIPLLHRTVELSFGPQEIKTLLLPDNEALPVQEVDLLERPL